MEKSQGLDLSPLLPLLQGMSAYGELVKELEGGAVRARVVGAAKPFLVAALHRELGLPLLLATAHAEGSKKLYEQLLLWCPDSAQVHLFPELDMLPYERLTPDPATVQERLRILWQLGRSGRSGADPGLPIIVASAQALAQKTVPPADFMARCHRLEVGMTVDLSRLLSDWLAMGYEMESAVEVPGTFSRRGGIIDIYPAAGPHPVRIELMGSRIDSLRSFDPSSQRSLGPVSSVDVMPSREFLVPLEGEGKPVGTSGGLGGDLDLSGLSPESRMRFEEEMDRLGEGHWFGGMEFYAPLFHAGCLLDYLPRQALIILDEPGEIEASLGELDEQGRGLREQQLAEGVLPPGFPAPYFSWHELEARAGEVSRRLSLEQWGAGAGDNEIPLVPAPEYGGQWPLLLKDIRQWLGEQARVLVVSQQAERVSELLEDEDIIAPALSQLSELPPPGSLTLLQGSLAQGWVSPSPGLALLSDAEIFGFVKARRWLRRRPVRHQVFLADLTPGDHVVHIDHGVSRFAGTTIRVLNNVEREYLVLEYSAGDKLYVPSDQIDRVSRYIGAGGQPPALSRLGTQEWSRTKQRVRQAVQDIAQELLELYAAREVAPGFAFSPDTSWQGELEMSFPYVETPDQQEAIEAVKADMEQPRPMDRLVCGDVGYGKTEVALRAAFKTVMDSKQVAMLVPTTVLAQQHFTSFKQRLAPFPLRVEMLSRFRSHREQQEVIERLSQGTVDICIGTHRLLQRDVAFKDLGLVIIDEEQRFGVVHKERLKRMRKEVDVLTLSATPIPRTLHMSLAGVRDMSTIETPPEERLPIQTYVAEYSDRLVREAILRELERDGQVFFVHNRVETISAVASRLMALVPEAEIAVGHGQMPEDELEAVMMDFSEGRFDVLVCTTIIESGLDMPNVNTLIINQADRLGLTQLYQLRGRVGRGGQRAYAYFLHGEKRLTPTAHQRLQTILEATELGAGFRIAMKDLEIRGAGNLLGTEQSGHIGAVGFDLYCRLMAEAVEGLRALKKGEPVPTPQAPSPSIDLPLPARIPEEYVSDTSARLALYQRLSRLQTGEGVEELARELGDRFGPPPPLVENLLYMVRMKALAVAAGIGAISAEDGEIVLRMAEGVIQRRPTAPPGVRVGRNQVRLNRKQLGTGWPRVLEKVLTGMAAP